jgi:phosphoribosylformylglycinamidine cyclo-ligase
VIVGLAGFGKANYEDEYNSGIASNGLTSARHDMLKHDYASEYPESFYPNTSKDVVYVGPYRLTEPVAVNWGGSSFEMPIGKLLLSPTRSFAPVIREILLDHFDSVHGMVHCSGGGQTKCLKYLPGGLAVIKDNLFDIPEIFKLIRKAGGADLYEMYQVFNMGCRLEIYTTAEESTAIIEKAQKYGVEARVIGRVVASENKYLELHSPEGIIKY